MQLWSSARPSQLAAWQALADAAVAGKIGGAQSLWSAQRARIFAHKAAGVSSMADMRSHHVVMRMPDLDTALRFYIEKPDVRVLAYPAPPTDNHF